MTYWHPIPSMNKSAALTFFSSFPSLQSISCHPICSIRFYNCSVNRNHCPFFFSLFFHFISFITFSLMLSHLYSPFNSVVLILSVPISLPLLIPTPSRIRHSPSSHDPSPSPAPHIWPLRLCFDFFLPPRAHVFRIFKIFQCVYLGRFLDSPVSGFKILKKKTHSSAGQVDGKENH